MKKLMLTTSMPLSPAYVSASSVGCRKKKPGVLPGADVDERHVRGDAGDPEAVERGADRAGDVRAVAVVVLVRPDRRSSGARTARRWPGCR